MSTGKKFVGEKGGMLQSPVPEPAFRGLSSAGAGTRGEEKKKKKKELPD